MSIPITWPNGNYGLFQPKSGCPDLWAADGKAWFSNLFVPIHTSSGSQLHVYIENERGYVSVCRLDFCVKTTGNDAMLDWPAGSYCIHRKGDCPDGMYLPS